MRLMVPHSFFLMCAVLAHAAPAQEAGAPPIRHVVLDNGLQVVAIRNPSVPFVTVEIAFRAGALAQLAESQAGLPHLIEHLLFRTSDGSSFDSRAARIQAGWNGVTDSESARYFMTFPARHLASGLELLADLVRKPDFGKQAVEAEQKIVQGELERRASDPEFLLLSQSDMLLWEGPGWIAKNAGGNLVAVLGAKPDSLRELYRKYYVPNNAALIVSGDVVDTAAFSLARKSFGGWRAGPDPFATTPAPNIPPLRGVKRKLLSGETNEVTLLARWHGPSAVDSRGDTYAADVFAGLVNHALSGTQRRLVDSGLFDEVSLSYDTRKYVGPIDLVARTSPERAAAAADALRAELSRMVRPDYFTDDDLDLAKRRQEVAAALRAESAEGSAHIWAQLWAATDAGYYESYADSLQAQRRSDVQRFVTRYLAGRPMVVTALVPAHAWTGTSSSLQRSLATWAAP